MQFVDTITPNQQQYFDRVGYTGRFADSRNAAMADAWAEMYYQNAYNTAVMNYQNEYNSPLQQMLRYQKAGINPFLAASESGNMTSAPSGGTPHTRGVPMGMDYIANIMSSLQTVKDVIDTSKDIYDYVVYGAPTKGQQLSNLQTLGDIYGIQKETADFDLTKHQAEAAWAAYWNGIEGASDLKNSPRGQYMEQSTARLAAQVEQLNALVNVLYPSQEQANIARAALDSYRTAVLQGETSPILELNTGNPEIDSVVKSVVLNFLKMSKFGVSAIF